MEQGPGHIRWFDRLMNWLSGRKPKPGLEVEHEVYDGVTTHPEFGAAPDCGEAGHIEGRCGNAQCLSSAIREKPEGALPFDARVASWLTGNKPLHSKTVSLCLQFAQAMASKLADAEVKYGYSDGWSDPQWMKQCRLELRQHVRKGDPRDVAAYCAFLWWHGESTAALSPGVADIKDAENEAVWAEYVAGMIVCYLAMCPRGEDREKAIAGIIKRRLMFLSSELK